MSSPESLVITTNNWRAPSPERAFDGWLEGCPTESEKLQAIAQAERDRSAWKPSAEGYALVEQLRAFVGHRVSVQMWDSIMYLLDNEGPFPFLCDCIGVILQKDGEHLQAYLQVANVVEQPTVDGYSPQGFLVERSESENKLVPLSKLYEVRTA